MSRHLRPALKTLAFVTVTGLLTVVIGMTFSGSPLGATETYRAVFVNISGLKDGDEVRAAGVSVGTVEGLRLRDDHTVEVSFAVPVDIPLPRSVRATVRYLNLAGDRYLDLTQGTGDGRSLDPGGVIPVAQTAPALDLDELFNGFKPLLRGLDPDEVNDVSASLIGIFDGRAGTVEHLLSRIASLTGTLADRDAVIGRLIDDLTTVLSTVDDRREEFSSLVVNLQRVVSGLSRDRDTIGDSLSRLNDLSGSSADLLSALRPELRGAVTQLGRVSAALNTETALVDRYLTDLPDILQTSMRNRAYGSFFNAYLCGVRLKLTGPDGKPVYTPFVSSEVARCRFP
jgi:phospholipid/cholesterol/gamma-HCH transport system substrate-binding protein